jgi:hypothetical protein
MDEQMAVANGLAAFAQYDVMGKNMSYSAEQFHNNAYAKAAQSNAVVKEGESGALSGDWVSSMYTWDSSNSQKILESFANSPGEFSSLWNDGYKKVDVSKTEKDSYTKGTAGYGENATITELTDAGKARAEELGYTTQ